MISNNKDCQIVPILKGDDAKAFKEYINSELTPLEKQELQSSLGFYLQNVSK